MMSGDKKNTIIYTAKDIEAYFSGQLPSSRMNAMERDALDDPFLAEAMEGYEAMQGRSWKPQLTALHRHFEEERSPAKVIPLNGSTSRWWKVAAAILVIGCGATLTYMLTSKKTADPGKETIAKTVPQQVSPIVTPQSDNITSTTTAKTPVTENHSVPATNSPIAQNTPPESNGPTTTAVNPTVVTVPAKDKIAITQAQATTDAKTSVATLDKKDKDHISTPATNTELFASGRNKAVPANSGNMATTAKASDDLASRKTEQKQAPANNSQSVSHNFAAQVVGPDNTPLPFANVTIKNEDFGTYADVRGNFKLVSTDSLINVEVRSVGYLPRVYTMHSSALQNRIVLAEDENTAKERSVVINDGAPSNRSARRGVLKDSLYVNVEPADGWDNYNAYVRNNIDIPENALKKDLHGEVEVSFKVHPDGTVTDITVSQSDCSDCAALAKRLVEQGPQWKIKKGIRKSSARIKVQF